MGLTNNEKRALVGALCLVAVLLLLWFMERGAATALAIVVAAVLTALLGVRVYRTQKEEDHKAALKTRRQDAYERYIAAFGKANRWKTEVDDWSVRAANLRELAASLQNGGSEEHSGVIEEHNFVVDKLREAEDNHRDAQAEYSAAHDSLLPAGSDQTIEAVNAFHRYYVNAAPTDPLEAKILYARMVVSMREDSFERTALSLKEVARNIPWTIGNEDSDPIDWDRVGDNGERL